MESSKSSILIGVRILQYYWLAVTPDKFELPMIVTETAQQLAEKLGIRKESVVTACRLKYSGKIAGYKIVKGERSEQ